MSSVIGSLAHTHRTHTRTHTLLVFVLALIKDVGGGAGSSEVCQVLE